MQRFRSGRAAIRGNGRRLLPFCRWRPYSVSFRSFAFSHCPRFALGELAFDYAGARPSRRGTSARLGETGRLSRESQWFDRGDSAPGADRAFSPGGLCFAAAGRSPDRRRSRRTHRQKTHQVTPKNGFGALLGGLSTIARGASTGAGDRDRGDHLLLVVLRVRAVVVAADEGRGIR